MGKGVDSLREEKAGGKGLRSGQLRPTGHALSRRAVPRLRCSGGLRACEGAAFNLATTGVGVPPVRRVPLGQGLHFRRGVETLRTSDGQSKCGERACCRGAQRHQSTTANCKTKRTRKE